MEIKEAQDESLEITAQGSKTSLADDSETPAEHDPDHETLEELVAREAAI